MSSTGDSELYRFLREVAGAQPDPAYLRVPRWAGRYRVGERLGQGGLGLVHAGWDPQLGRAVAIKFVRLDKTGGEPGQWMQGRLRTEAQTLAKLAHPHVVPVFDVGDADGQVFIAMQRIEGITLRRWLETRPSLARKLAVFEAAGAGLAAAHEVGVLHRDIKPENVLVGEGDHAWVVDFGLAHEIQTPTEDTLVDGSGDSQTRGVIGTTGYIAPEVLDGEPATPQSDQYGFCKTLQTAIGADAPGWLTAIVDRGLDPDPSARFPSMRALITALHRGGERRSWRILGALVGASVLCLVAAAAIPSPRPGAEEREADAHAVRSSAAAADNLARGREAEARDDPDADVYLQAAFFEGREAGDDAVAGAAATRLAVVDLHRARLDGAKYWIEHARALRGDDPDVAVIAAAIKVFDGQPEVALRELQASLDDDASADALLVAGQAAVQLEQPALAKTYFERAGGENGLYHLVDLELELGELDAAQEHLRRVFALETEPAGPSAAVRRMQMGNLLREQGKLDEALAYLDEAAAMMAGLDHPDEAVIEEARGLVYEMKGDTATARAAYERALVIREATGGRDHEFTAYTLLRLTSVVDDPAQSLAYAEEAREILIRTLGPESVVVAATHAAAAEINLGRGRFEEARFDAEKAVMLYARSERLPDELARAKLLLADLLWRDRDERGRARTLAGEAEAFLATAGEGNAPYLEAARTWLREHPQ